MHSTTSNLKLHIKTVHVGTKFKCNLCGKECSQISNLNKHMNNVHNKVPIKCRECKYEHINRDFVSQHIKIVHRKQYPMCHECNKPFSKFGSNYQKHINMIPRSCKNKWKGHKYDLDKDLATCLKK